MAKKEWYVKSIILPWETKQSGMHVIITNDRIEIERMRDKMMVEMAIRKLLDSAVQIARGSVAPTKVDLYYAYVESVDSVKLKKHEFWLDEESISKLSDEERKMLIAGRGTDVVKLFKEGKIRIFVKGMTLGKDGAFKIMESQISGMNVKNFPKPMYISLTQTRGQGGTKKFEEMVARTKEEYMSLPANVVFKIFIDKFEFGSYDTTTLLYYENAVLNEKGGGLNETVPIKLFSKNAGPYFNGFFKSMLVTNSAIVTPVSKLSFLPENVRTHANVIFREVPSREEIHNYMKSVLKEMKLSGKVRGFEITDELLDAATGLSLGEVAAAMRQSAKLYGRLEVSVFKEMKIAKLKALNINYIEPKIDLSYVGGMHALRKSLDKSFLKYLKHPELAAMVGRTPPRGFILTGVGGTGKTWLVEALAGSLGRPVISLSASDFMSKYVGESEQNLRRILDIAEQMGAVVFIDEIDAIGKSRESLSAGDSGTSQRIVNQLMVFLGKPDRKAIVIGATNEIQQLDENFIRSGRFDKIYYVSPPDYQGRLEILKIHALKLHKTNKHEFEEGVLERVAKETEWFVGSDLALIIDMAKDNAIQDYLNSNKKDEKIIITYKHFRDALDKLQINVDVRKESVRRTLGYLRRLPAAAVDLDTVLEAERRLSGMDGNVKVSEEEINKADFTSGGIGVEDSLFDEGEEVEDTVGKEEQESVAETEDAEIGEIGEIEDDEIDDDEFEI